MLFGDFLNPGNCFKLALVPIPGVIRLPESAEFRRKATLLRRIAVLVFAAQKPAGKRIEWNHRKTFFLHQREKFSLNFTEQQIVTWLSRNETRQLQRVLPSKRFCQTVCEEIRYADIARPARTQDRSHSPNHFVDRSNGVIHMQLVKVNVIRI